MDKFRKKKKKRNTKKREKNGKTAVDIHMLCTYV